MGFLDNFLTTKQEGIFSHWKVLDQMDQLEQLKADSFEKPVVIFKHSIRCGTSSMAQYMLQDKWDFKAEELDFYYLDIINNRPISNKIAEDYGVVHHSPQILVVKSGQVVFDTSHHKISVPVILDNI